MTTLRAILPNHRLATAVGILGLLLASDSQAKDRFQSFLDEVRWIASQKELREAETLSDDAARQAFVDRFWRRRDPSPGTERNEFKEEHYRRWEHVNKAFSEGVAGWRTDRGRVFLIHGKPDEESFLDIPTPGRPGGRRSHQSIVWTYFQLPNAEYYRGRITLVFQPNIGLTEQDFMLGESRRAQGQAAQLYRRSGVRASEMIETAVRYRLVAAGPPASMSVDGGTPASGIGEYARFVGDLLRSPGEDLEKREELVGEGRRALRELIETEVLFGVLSLKMVAQPFYAEGIANVAVTVQIPISEIAFETRGLARVGKIDLLAQVKDSEGRVVDEFFKDFDLVYSEEQFAQAGDASFRHFNEFHLPPGHYRIAAVVRDRSGQKVGVVEEAVECRDLRSGRLALSGLVAASSRIDPEAAGTGGLGRDLVVEGWRLVPEADLSFPSDQRLVLLAKVYNGGVTAEGPRVLVSANFIRDGQTVRQAPQRLLTSFDPPGSDVMVYSSVLDLADFAPGRYQLQVSAVDLVSKQFDYQRLSLDIH